MIRGRGGQASFPHAPLYPFTVPPMSSGTRLIRVDFKAAEPHAAGVGESPRDDLIKAPRAPPLCSKPSGKGRARSKLRRDGNACKSRVRETDDVRFCAVTSSAKSAYFC